MSKKSLGRRSGNPSKKETDAQTVMSKSRELLELVKTLDGKISEDSMVHLKASVLGLMFVYSDLTKTPPPYPRK